MIYIKWDETQSISFNDFNYYLVTFIGNNRLFLLITGPLLSYFTLVIALLKASKRIF